MKRPFFLIGSIFLITLNIVPRFTTSTALICFLLFLLLTIFSFFIRAYRKTAMVALFAVFLSLGVYVLHMALGYEPYLPLNGKSVQLTGTITDIEKKRAGDYRYMIKVTKINDCECRTPFRISLYQEDPLPATVYDSLEGSFFLTLGEDPAAYDSKYLNPVFKGKNEGYIFSSYVKRDQLIIRPPEKRPFLFYFFAARQYGIQTITRALPGQEGAVAQAILFGDKSRMSVETDWIFNVTGISHIIVVSGAHLSIIVKFLSLLIRKLRFPKTFSTCISVFAVLAVMAMIGFTNSITRAGIMIISLMIGSFFHRETDALNSLGFAVTGLLLVSPFAAGNVGFLLSVFAVWGLFILCPRISTFLTGAAGRNPFRILRFLLKLCANPLAASCAACVFILPLSFLYFDTVSTIAPLTNLLVFFAASLILIFTGIGVAVSAVPFFVPLAAPVFWLVRQFSAYMLSVCGLLAKIPFAALPVSFSFLKIWMIFAVILLFLYLKKKPPVISLKLFFTSVLCILLAGVFSFQIASHNVMRLCFFQDAVSSWVLAVKNGQTVLFDYNGSSEFNVKYALQDYGAKQIDLLVLSNPDSSGESRLKALAETVPVHTLALPEASPFYTELVLAANRCGIETIGVSGQTELSLLNGADLTLNQTPRSNLYTLLRYRNFSFLMLGLPESGLSSCFSEQDLSASLLFFRNGSNGASSFMEADFKTKRVVFSSLYGIGSADARLLLNGYQAVNLWESGQLVIKTRGSSTKIRKNSYQDFFN